MGSPTWALFREFHPSPLWLPRALHGQQHRRPWGHTVVLPEGPSLWKDTGSCSGRTAQCSDLHRWAAVGEFPPALDPGPFRPRPQALRPPPDSCCGHGDIPKERALQSSPTPLRPPGAGRTRLLPEHTLLPSSGMRWIKIPTDGDLQARPGSGLGAARQQADRRGPGWRGPGLPRPGARGDPVCSACPAGCPGRGKTETALGGPAHTPGPSAVQEQLSHRGSQLWGGRRGN